MALRAYEQMIERENHSTMGIDPRRRLQQIQCAISMLESCDSRNMAGDPMTSISSGDEVCKLGQYVATLTGLHSHQN